MPYRGREKFRGRGRRRGRGSFIRSENMEYWTCGKKGHMSGRCPEFQCFLCYKKGHTAQFCPGKSVNLVSIEGEANLNNIKRISKKIEKSFLSPKPKYNLIQDIFQQRAKITYG